MRRNRNRKAGDEPRPFLKWAGGKTSLLSVLLKRVPKHFDTYYEPFVGGGALFFALRPPQAVLGDLNDDLIGAYRVVQQKVEPLIEDLARHRHSERYYYKLRNVDRDSAFWVWSDVARASRLIYLNKTCFNGLYRVNSRGEFNVPYGQYKEPKILDVGNLLACHRALQNVTLIAGSYERVLRDARRGDFVYLDPPFAPLSATAKFTAYNRNGFDGQQQEKLRDYCRELDRRKVNFMLSNSATPVVWELYRDFQIETVEAPRAINAKGSGRGKIKEALVVNY